MINLLAIVRSQMGILRVLGKHMHVHPVTFLVDDY